MMDMEDILRKDKAPHLEHYPQKYKERKGMLDGN
jgi:hypothetical protein